MSTVKTFQRAGKKTKPTVASKPRRSRQAGPPRLIESESDLQAGIKALRRKCDVLRRLHDVTGDPPLRRRPGGFEGLARIVIGQQVSVASANAIWTRFEQAVQPMSAQAVALMSENDLRAAGLSGPKVRTMRAVSNAVLGGLDLTTLGALAPEEARARLLSVSGIGPWTADVYLMFCLGCADVFAPGDLALQVAAQWAFGMTERPTADALAVLAEERWSPWRGVAARLLWHSYAHVKAAKSGQPV